jgi:putative transposase
MKQNFRKSIRLKQYDYKSDGYYFVTIVTKNREDLLLGREVVVEEELKDLLSKTPGVLEDYKIVMSNHMHLILILKNSTLALGEIVRRLKAKIARRLGGNVWEANYYEHIIRSDQALNKIREYVIYNPELTILKFDQFYS